MNKKKKIKKNRYTNKIKNKKILQNIYFITAKR